MRRALKTAILVLLAAWVAAACSCVWVGELLYSLDPDPTEAPQTEPPFGTAGPTASPETQAADPLVSARDFAAGLLRLWGESTRGMTEAACEAEGAEELYTDLLHDWAGFASVCAMLSDAASGTLMDEEGFPYAAVYRTQKDGSFSVESENGVTLNCSLVAGGVLEVSVTGGKTPEFTAAKSGSGYIIRFAGEPASYIEVKSGSVRYARVEKAGSLTFPEDAAQSLVFSGGLLAANP